MTEKPINSIGKNDKAAPRNLASRFGERFFVKARLEKRRNTVCISSFSNCTVGAKDPLITADNFISGYWGFVAADSTYTRYAFVRAPSSDRKSLTAGGAERSVGADDPVRPFPQASTAPCRGRCRAQLFATKERYRCGLPLAGTHRPASVGLAARLRRKAMRRAQRPFGR